MGEDQRQRRRALVGLAALDADPAVLDHVDAAPAVRRRRSSFELVDQLDAAASASPSSATGTPCSKPMTTSRGSVAVGFGHRPHAGRRHGPRVLHLAALDGAAPEVLVDRVQLLLRRRDRDVVVGRRRGSSPRGSSPTSRTGREHLEVGRERPGRHLEAHLVVALAGAAVGDRVGAVLAGRGDEVLRRSPAATAPTPAGTCPRTARWP